MSTIIFKTVNVNKFVAACELYATAADCVFMCHCEVTYYFFFLVIDIHCPVLSADSVLFDTPSTCHILLKTSLSVVFLALVTPCWTWILNPACRLRHLMLALTLQSHLPSPPHQTRSTPRASLLVHEKNKWRYFNMSLNVTFRIFVQRVQKSVDVALDMLWTKRIWA
jgi:hypothetical protein